MRILDTPAITTPELALAGLSVAHCQSKLECGCYARGKIGVDQKRLSFFRIYRRPIKVDLFAPPMSYRGVRTGWRRRGWRPRWQIYWWWRVMPFEAEGRKAGIRRSNRLPNREIEVMPCRRISPDGDPHLQQAGIDIQ